MAPHGNSHSFLYTSQFLSEEKLKKSEEERRLKYWGDDKFKEEKEIHSEESADDGPEVSKKDLN